MTFDDDSIVIDGRPYSCQKLGLEWPPPAEVYVVLGRDRLAGGVAVVGASLPGTVTFRQVSRSKITDEQRADMTHVFRGAVYERVAS